VKNLRSGLAAVALALILIMFAGCASASPAQTAAAQKLAADCKRNAKDPSLEFIHVDGGAVRIVLTEEQRKKLDATLAQDISAGNMSDLLKEGSPYLEGLGIGAGIMADVKCLAQKTGAPTDKNGDVKPGDWLDWHVAHDEYGNPVFTSIVKG
jgi:hypothetical protein